MTGNIRYYFYDYLRVIFIFQMIKHEKKGNSSICKGCWSEY